MILNFHIVGVARQGEYADGDSFEEHLAVLEYKGDRILEAYFTPFEFRWCGKFGIEVHINCNERLITKHKLPYRKHRVAEDYREYKKGGRCKKSHHMKALDLGIHNVSILARALREYSRERNGIDYNHILVNGRSTGMNPDYNRTNIIKIR